MTLREYLDQLVILLIKFQNSEINHSEDLRKYLEAFDLNALHRTLQGKPKPKPKLTIVEGLKEHFHAACFEDYVRRERANGIFNPDRGSRPFGANFGSRCPSCGIAISPGERIVARKAYEQEQAG